MLTVLSHYRY